MALIDNATAFWPLGDSLSSNKLMDTMGRGNDLTPYLRPAPVTLDFRMGSSNNPAQQLFGALSKWGKWNRLLSSTEKGALYAKQSWPFSATPSLSDAAVYFLLDEPTGSASYADATGRGNTLLSQGTPTQTAGPLASDKGTLFGAGDSLWRPATSDLQTGNHPWTVCGWVKLSSPIPSGELTQQIFWGQWQTHGQTSGTNIYFDQTTTGFATFCVDGGFPNSLAQGPAITNTKFMNPAAETWYFILTEYDPEANALSLSINNQTSLTSSLPLIQQPIPAVGKVGYGSRFFLNEQFNFGANNGWDRPPSPDGSCHAFLDRNSDVSFGNNSFTVWGWFKTKDMLATGSNPQTLVGIFRPSPSAIEWVVQLTRSNGKCYLWWVVGDGGAGYNAVSVEVTNIDWNFFACWYDKSTGSIHLKLNDASPLSSAITVTPGCMYGSARLTLGAASRTAGDGQQFEGMLNAIGVARGVPTTSDLSMLWNGGNGILVGQPRHARPTAIQCP